MTELKPCPFCGGKAELKHRLIFGSAYSMIQCLSCGCQSAEIQANVGYCADERAAEVWNKRTQFDDGGYHDGA